MTNLKQISPQADKILHKLSREIGRADGIIKEATKEFDDAWVAVFDLMAEFDTDGRFIADDGHYLQRQSRQGSPKLDEAKLEQLLRDEFDYQKFSRIWNLITDRKVNTLKLEQAVQAGKIPAKFLEVAITMPPLTYARVRRPWSREDAEKARIFGVEKRDE